MSRYTKAAADKTFVYGFDHALGYFYEEWLNFGQTDEVLLSDTSSLFGKLSRSEMLDKMHQYRVPGNHIDLVAKDLPF